MRLLHQNIMRDIFYHAETDKNRGYCFMYTQFMDRIKRVKQTNKGWLVG